MLIFFSSRFLVDNENAYLTMYGEGPFDIHDQRVSEPVLRAHSSSARNGFCPEWTANFSAEGQTRSFYLIYSCLVFKQDEEPTIGQTIKHVNDKSCRVSVQTRASYLIKSGTIELWSRGGSAKLLYWALSLSRPWTTSVWFTHIPLQHVVAQGFQQRRCESASFSRNL